jgi:hypothetical protein
MFATYTLWAPGNMAVGLQNKFLSGSKKKKSSLWQSCDLYFVTQPPKSIPYPVWSIFVMEMSHVCHC